MKKTICIVLACLVVIASFGFYIYDVSLVMGVHKSPDGDYELIIKNERGFFRSTMPGDGGPDSTPVLLILKDKTGRTIAKDSDNPDCGIFYGSLDIKWDMKNHRLWYGVARIIDLKTGRVEC